MNKGGLIGVLFALLIAECLFLGIQLSIWGGTAPDWYAIPTVLGSMALGSTGWLIGSSR